MGVAWVEVLKSEGFSVTDGPGGYHGWRMVRVSDGTLKASSPGYPYATEGDAWAGARGFRNSIHITGKI